MTCQNIELSFSHSQYVCGKKNVQQGKIVGRIETFSLHPSLLSMCMFASLSPIDFSSLNIEKGLRLS